MGIWRCMGRCGTCMGRCNGLRLSVPMQTIKEVWPSFPPTYADDDDDEDDDDDDNDERRQ